MSFLELDAALKAEDDESALAASEAILESSPGDATAFQCKVVALIKMSRYQEAFDALDSRVDDAVDQTFERAYCLYMLNREQESLKALGDASTLEGRGAQLAAQIHYRLGEAEKAVELFRKAEADLGGQSSETSINLLAALVSAGQADEALKYAAELSDSGQFEQQYNHACACIESGHLSKAQALLQRASQMCRKTLTEDEYTEEEIEVELGILTAQLAYVEQRMGEDEAAMTAYTTLFGFKAELDPAVAANNTVALRGTRDLFDSWKKCRANISETASRKLTKRQRHAFHFNAALLSMHMNKPDQCKEVLATMERLSPGSEQAVLVRAAMLHRAKQTKQCEELLEQAAASSPDAPRPLLSLAQLQLQAKDVQKAVATLQRIGALRTTLGMLGTLVALHERIGNVDAAAEGLGKALEGTTDEKTLRAAAGFFSKHGRWEQAAAAHQRLLDANARDLQALAGLVVATSHFDAAASQEHYARLELMSPPEELDTEEGGVDAAALETAPLPRAAKRLGAKDAAAAAAAAAAATAAAAGASSGGGVVGSKRAADAEPAAKPKKKRPRRKKPLYPKGFDPANPGPPPDPERWLPKRDRSYYRKTKKDKRSGISRGPQGSATGAAKVDAKVTTDLKESTAEEKAARKAAEEKAAAQEKAAAAAMQAGKKKKGKK